MKRKSVKNTRRSIAKAHLVIAFICGVPVLIMSLTGSILSFERELERLLSPGLLKVEACGGSFSRQAMAERLREEFPKLNFRYIFLPQTDDGVIRFRTGGGIPTEVFVNPCDGSVVGSRKMMFSVTAVARSIHTTFLVGKLGSRIAGASSLCLILSLFTGLYLWWSSAIRKRKKITTVRTGRGLNVLNYDIHTLIGVVAFTPMFVLALTGAVFSFPEVFRPAIYGLTSSGPPEPRPETIPVPEEAGSFDLDTVLELASRANPGAVPTIVALPREPSSPFRVNMRRPGETHYTGRHYVFIDPWKNEVIDNRRPEDVSIGHQLIMANRVLHTGELGGLPLRLLFFVTSFACALLVAGGFIHWGLPRLNRSRRSAIKNTKEVAKAA